VNPINSLALRLHARKRYRAALFLYRVALFLRRSNPVLLNNVGVALRDLGKRQRAIQYLERSLDLDPSFMAPRNMLGNIHMELGDLAKGVEILETLASTHPDYPIPHYTLATHYYWMEDYDLARKYLEGYFSAVATRGNDGSLDNSVYRGARALQYELDHQAESPADETDTEP
jgi:tetratricopeptide (TPR) repeat protein